VLYPVELRAPINQLLIAPIVSLPGRARFRNRRREWRQLYKNGADSAALFRVFPGSAT